MIPTLQAVSLALALLAASLTATAQTRGPRLERLPPVPPEQTPGLTLRAERARALYLDARRVLKGTYYFTIRVTIARDTSSPDKRVYLSVFGFSFITDRGKVYRPTSVPGSSARIDDPCESRYLAAGDTVTCPLAFQVPSDITAGTLEFEPGFRPVLSVAITIGD